jgi:hypothetical protein
VVLDDLAVYLQAQGLGTRSQTIFEGRIPSDAPGSGVADQIITLFAVPGLPPQHVHDIVGPAVDQPVVQVRVRGSAAQGGYAAMWTQAEQAYRLLDSVRNQVVNGTFYQAILALQSPFGLGEDQYQRPFLAFNVRCAKAAS